MTEVLEERLRPGLSDYGKKNPLVEELKKPSSSLMYNLYIFIVIKFNKFMEEKTNLLSTCI